MWKGNWAGYIYRAVLMKWLFLFPFLHKCYNGVVWFVQWPRSRVYFDTFYKCWKLELYSVKMMDCTENCKEWKTRALLEWLGYFILLGSECSVLLQSYQVYGQTCQGSKVGSLVHYMPWIYYNLQQYSYIIQHTT